MKNKKISFMDHLEYYFNIYLPTVKGLSKSTIVSYKATFRILMEFLYTVKGIPSDKVEFSTFDDKLIMEFLSWLETERSCSVSTRNQRLSAIAAFSIYAQNRDFGSAVTFRNCVLKVPKKKVPRKGRSSFTRDEVKTLFQSSTPTSSGGLKNAPKGSVTAHLKGRCHKLILLAAAKKRLLHFLPSGTLLTVPGYISLWHPL